MTVEELVGERLMIGLPGAVLTDDDVKLFRETSAAGLILYRRNFESPAGLVSLLTSLEEALGRRLLVSTDHEGGRIVMLGQGTTIFPDNLAVASAGDVAQARAQGRIEARELRRLGVDLNLGPCLDVLTDRYSPNIGIRSYGKDPKTVAKFGIARLRASEAGGVACCVKHFPGKGHSPLDAHLKLPTIDSTWEQMRNLHLPPFAEAIAAGVSCVMTSHPRYPNLDPSGEPATFSRRLVDDLLRRELGFTGVIVSDDLEMGAVSEVTSIGQATVQTAAAGHDLLLVCHTPAAQREAHAALLDAYRSRSLPLEGLEASAARVRALRESRGPRFTGGVPHAERDGEPLARAMATRAVTVVAAPDAGWKPALNGRVVAIFPRLSSLADRITIEPAMQDEAGYLTSGMAPHGVRPEVIVVGVESTADEIESARAAAAVADATVLFLYDAHLYESNRALLEACQSAAKRLAVVLMRDPWDAEFLAPGVAAITAYGWRRSQLDAVLARLLT